MDDTLRERQKYWDGFAASDPLWTVLAFPDKSDGRWTVSEFMKTGEREIALLFHRFAELRLPLPRGSGLDFGCGVGRLTQAMARRMNRVVGVDISPVMIDHARRLNQYPNRAEYLCTAEAGLERLPSRSFQCIYSNIVLQHVASELAVQYLDEFFRLLEPDGLLVFQLPSHKQPQVDAEIHSMPPTAYRASIELPSAPPASVAVGSEFSLTFIVRNVSSHEWRQPEVGPLALGNHWLAEGGELMVIQDDGRSPLLQIVPPGLEWPVLMTMRAPAAPGRYVVEIDLVHEGITWYGHAGSSTLRFSIDVTATHGTAEGLSSAAIQEYPIPQYPENAVPRPARSPSSAATKAEFPMSGVPREQVMQIIHANGGRLTHLEEDRRAGPEWVSYRYFVVGTSS
jgi:SAM-dependent methyltransferase